MIACSRFCLRLLSIGAYGAMAVAWILAAPARAHHSFAMYDQDQIYILTGLVTRVDPNPNHLQLFIAPLNDARDQVIRDDNDELIVWAVEMPGAARAAQDGITVNSFTRGTIVSVGIHPLRNGLPAGGGRELGLFKCPPDTPPAPSKHCDSVPGSTTHGQGEKLAEPTGELPGSAH